MTQVALFTLDDDPNYHRLLEIILEAKQIRNYRQCLTFRELQQHANKDVGVYIIDHYLGGDLYGLDVVRFIRNAYGYEPNILILSNSDEGRVIREYIAERIYSYRLKTEDYGAIGNDISDAMKDAQDKAERRNFIDKMRRELD